MKTYICLDIETTDLDPNLGDIIEIAGIRIENGKILDEFQTLIKPSKEIPRIVKAVTGITDEMVVQAPELNEIIDDLKKFISDSPIVGHNIDFDLDYLKAKGICFENKRYDTWKLATILLPNLSSHSLEALVSYLKLKNIESHRALDDVKACERLFLFLLNKIKEIDPLTLREITKLLEKREWTLKDLFEARVLHETRETHETHDTHESRDSRDSSDSSVSSDSSIAFDIKTIVHQFEKAGNLAKSFNNFEFRPNQVEMMKKVAEAFAGKKHLVCEAGPGVGKSLAYLLPAVYFAKTNKEKVVISTHTLNLQDQLLKKDVPIVRKAVNFDFIVKKLVGRENYLCWRRFKELRNRKKLSEDEITALIKILLWQNETKEGILSEIAWTFDEDKIKRSLCCDVKFCLKKKCPSNQKCFYYQAKKQAQASDLVIINHALLASSYLEQENSLDFKHLIIDEAHRLEDAVSSKLTRSVSQTDILEYLKKLDALLRNIKQIDTSQVLETKEKLESQVDLFFGILGMFIKNYAESDFYQGKVKMLLNKQARDSGDFWKISGMMNNLILRFDILEKELEKLFDYLSLNFSKKSEKLRLIIYDIEGYIKQNKEIRDFLKEIIIKPNENTIYWLSYKDEKIILFSGPLTVSKFLSENLFKQKETIILTSATLTTDQGFKYFEAKLGLDNSFDKIQIPSHYLYAKQAEIIIPTDFPLPNYPDFNNKVCDVLFNIAKYLKGRTLALFTSYSAIKTVYKRLAYDLRNLGIKVLAQGVTGGKMKLLEEFKRNKKTILLGTSSFWEGVDIPGENLSCLVITKLPFEMPFDPVFKAKADQYKNGFLEYSVPRAILTLKQGFGRLIRSSQDKGVVVILDLRIENTEYGLKFLQALPRVGVEHLEINKIGQTIKEFITKK